METIKEVTDESSLSCAHYTLNYSDVRHLLLCTFLWIRIVITGYVCSKIFLSFIEANYSGARCVVCAPIGNHGVGVRHQVLVIF